MIRRSLCFPWNQWWDQYTLAWCWLCSQCSDVCLLCIQLPAHLAALDFCRGGQGCSKALGISCTTFTQQPVTWTKWTWTCCLKWLSGFDPLPRGLAFSLNFPKFQGVRISSIHHELQLQPTCGLQNNDFRNSSGGLGGAGNSTQNLNCYECIKIFKKMILN